MRRDVRPKSKKKYVVNVVLPRELHAKIHRIASRQDRSAGAVLRVVIAEMTEPAEAS